MMEFSMPASVRIGQSARFGIQMPEIFIRQLGSCIPFNAPIAQNVYAEQVNLFTAQRLSLLYNQSTASFKEIVPTPKKVLARAYLE